MFLNWPWEPPNKCGGRSALALRERISISPCVKRGQPFPRVLSKRTDFQYIEVLVLRGGRYAYAGVMCRLIAYSRSSAFVLTFNVSIIRYL
jgi:hypothetical protein